MKRKFVLKRELLALGKYFALFIRRLLVFAFYYGIYAVCSYGVALICPSLLEAYIGLSHNLCLIIGKILLTIAPVVPSIVYLRCYEEDTNGEFSIDLCFVAWIATVVWAWVFL